LRARFLLDENVPRYLAVALLRRLPEVNVLRVGDEGAPALGTLDPEILRYLETSHRILITHDWASIPGHVAKHIAAGGHHWGILWVRPNTPPQRVLEAIILVWEASDANEWVDVVEWIPFD
jgi:predicted nuclease of predicted toxin-antitoxin system